MNVRSGLYGYWVAPLLAGPSSRLRETIPFNAKALAF
jgi:hypothetical protein